ncbi:MAG: hypothetical protein EZS28_045909 [Streblomastix strix]|uniref:Uncharacterized protein n=1 Tax=Streblomastix strix TaxID=222440 RepID=A0A5J4TJK8_9EUKA|nr:MAG: hypothetical protein EZS28_045909 [Streblomastix strix]
MINRHQHQEVAVANLVKANYIGVLVIAISTVGGSGEEEDWQIFNVLDYISRFLSNLNKGRNRYYKSTFPPQLLLTHRSDEQIEEEGGNEEIDSQLINKGRNIKNKANRAQGEILNYFIEQGNTRPDWYNW